MAGDPLHLRIGYGVDKDVIAGPVDANLANSFRPRRSNKR
jgi:hypothetical protein